MKTKHGYQVLIFRDRRSDDWGITTSAVVLAVSDSDYIVWYCDSDLTRTIVGAYFNKTEQGYADAVEEFNWRVKQLS